MIRVLRSGRTVYHASPETIRGQLFDPETLDYQCANIGLQSTMGRAHCFREVGGFDNNLMAYIDLDLFTRLSKRYTFARIKEPLVKYYETKGIQSNFRYKFHARKYLLDKYENGINNKSILSKQYFLLAVTLQQNGDYRDSLHYVFRALHADRPSARCVMHATYLISGVHMFRVKVAQLVRSIL